VPQSALSKLIRGNTGHRRISEPLTPTLPAAPIDPPDWLPPDARAEWRRLAPELHGLGLLTELDQSVFAAYCASVARWREAERQLARTEGGSLADADHARVVRAARLAMADAMKFGQAFGLGSHARARLASNGSGPGKFHGLLA
jgi:P27 family predicted phage terminase small subunit